MIALDVAIIPPPAVSSRAIELSAALPEEESQGLRLGQEFLPHVTLTQQFVRTDDLEAVLDRVQSIVAGLPPLALRVTGGAKGSSSVWMAVEASQPLVDLHIRLMNALERFEVQDGSARAFADGDARPADVQWVSGYRRSSSFTAFRPHITLGHAAAAPAIEPFPFEATTIAACHLGRFCSCRRVIREWTLAAA